MDEPSLGYRVDGEGRPLLLVHGFGIPYNIWKNLIPLLRPHFKLILVELPGIGVSPMPPHGKAYSTAAVEGIDRLRESLGFDTWMVLGYSSGSRIAESYVQAHAAHVSRAFFVCPLQLNALKTRALRLALWLDGYLPALGSWILRGWRLKFLISWLGFNLRPDPRCGDWYAEIESVPVAVLRQTLRMLLPVVSRPFSVPVPRTMIWADEDLVPDKPRDPDAHDGFVHGRHAAPLESAEEIAGILTQPGNQ